MEKNLQELSEFIRKSYIRIIGIPEEEERVKGTKSPFTQIVHENF